MQECARKNKKLDSLQESKEEIVAQNLWQKGKPLTYNEQLRE
jgi:hypothetical protein